jgi:hypothetical protein
MSMVSYNITVKVPWSVEPKWLEWELNEELPAMVRTGCFDHFKCFRLMELDEEDGPTYTIQLFASSRADYLRYTEHFSDSFHKRAVDKWGSAYTPFHTAMEQVG